MTVISPAQLDSFTVFPAGEKSYGGLCIYRYVGFLYNFNKK